MFLGKGILKTCSKITGEHPFQSLSIYLSISIFLTNIFFSDSMPSPFKPKGRLAKVGLRSAYYLKNKNSQNLPEVLAINTTYFVKQTFRSLTSTSLDKKTISSEKCQQKK